MFTVLRGKSYNCRGSAANGAACTSHPGVAGWSIPLLQVYMCIDAARCDEGALAVQNTCISRIQTLQVTSNTEDDAVFDAYVLSNDAIRCINLEVSIRSKNRIRKAKLTMMPLRTIKSNSISLQFYALSALTVSPLSFAKRSGLFMLIIMCR